MDTRSIVCMVFAAAVALAAPPATAAESKGKGANLDSASRSALNTLYAKQAGAKALGKKAVAILVFPSVTKAGFVVGGQYGEGALMKGGKTVAYYNTAGASYGLQAGAQKYGYAMFFMTQAGLSQLDKADGFEIGVGPTVVVVDEGMAKSLTTMTLDQDVYAFIFSQKGLMAGLGIQGNKITKMEPK